MEEEKINRFRLANPKTNKKTIESIVSGSLVHFRIPKHLRPHLVQRGWKKFTKSPRSKNSFFKAVCLGIAKYYNSYFVFVYLGKPFVVEYRDQEKNRTCEFVNIFTPEQYKLSYSNCQKENIPGIFR